MGDVPITTGVCSDVLVRAFRKAGVDLQQEVHEDMKRAWDEYPKRWGLSEPDANIDHRRVLNLMKYFERGRASHSVWRAILPAASPRMRGIPLRRISRK